MRADELDVGSTYAWIEFGIGRPLAATVLEKPKGGQVKVSVYDPDEGFQEMELATRELANGWDKVPDYERFDWPELGKRIKDAPEELTWRKIYGQRVAHIGRHRALAQRLLAFGIVREPATYKGVHNNHPKVQLTLNFDELELLLGRAESARGPRLDPTAVAVEPPLEVTE